MLREEALVVIIRSINEKHPAQPKYGELPCWINPVNLDEYIPCEHRLLRIWAEDIVCTQHLDRLDITNMLSLAR